MVCVEFYGSKGKGGFNLILWFKKDFKQEMMFKIYFRKREQYYKDRKV